MTESEAIEKLRAYYNCQRLQAKCIYEDCNDELCDSCNLCYAQGTTGEHIKSIEIAIQALEKQIPKNPNHKYIKYGRHKWKKDEYGKIDDLAWKYKFCNGVVCERCGESVCVHCNPDYDKLDDCEANIYSCPFCDKKVGYRQKYCDCGQKLDWSDEE